MTVPDSSLRAAEIPPDREYWCFISYRHRDDKEQDRNWAGWLHREIERYDVPAELVGTTNGRGDVIPERIYPVFRDEDSLPANADLGHSIESALDRSRFLLVICSPRAVESRYVAQEIEHFKESGKGGKILAAIIAGEPGDPERECFPEPLREVVADDGKLSEPIAADFRLDDGGEGFTSVEAYRLRLADQPRREAKRKARAYDDRLRLMVLKVIAGILGVALEDLRDRDKAYQLELARRRARRNGWLAGIGLVLFASAVAGAIIANNFRIEAIKREARIAGFLVESGKNQIQAGDDPRKAMFAFYRALEGVDRNSETAMKARALLGEYSEKIGTIFVHDGPVIGASPGDSKDKLLTLTEGKGFSLWDVSTRLPVDLKVYSEEVAASRESSKKEGQIDAGGPKLIDGKRVLAYHEDRRLAIIQGSETDRVELREVNGGTIRAIWKHDAKVSALIRDPKRSARQIGGLESEVLPQLEGQELIGKLSRFPAFVSYADFSPDGTRAVTLGNETPLRIWDTGTGNLILRTGPASTLRAIVSAKNKYILSADSDLVLRTRDWATGAILKESESVSGRIGFIVFNSDESRFATHSPDLGAVRVWDAKSLIPIGPEIGGVSHYPLILFSPDDSGHLFLGTEKNTIEIRNANTFEKLGETVPQGGAITGLIVQEDGVMITSSADRTARLMPNPLVTIARFKHEKDVNDIDVSVDGKVLASCSRDGFFRVWDLDPLTGKATLRFAHEPDEFRTLLSIAVSQDGKFLAWGDTFGGGALWDLEKQRKLADFDDDQMIFAIDFHPDGRQFLTSNGGGMVTVHGVPDVEVQRQIKHLSQGMKSCYSPDGRLIATGGNGPVRLWKVETGEEIKLSSMIAGETGATALAFSPDSTRIVTGNFSQFARVWDVSTGAPLSPPLQHEGAVLDAAYDTSGLRFATVSDDGSARVWDSETFEEIVTPIAHSATVETCAFVPNLDLLVTGDDNGLLRLIPLKRAMPEFEGAKLLKWLEVQTGMVEKDDGVLRNLTQAEWLQRVKEFGASRQRLK